MQVVLYRVELSVAQKVEVVAVRVERRCYVVEERSGHRNRVGVTGAGWACRCRVGQLVEADLRGVQPDAEAVGQPASVMRPVHPCDWAPLAAVHTRQLAVLQIYDQQFLAVVGQGHGVFCWGDLQGNRAANVQTAQPARRFVEIGGEDDQFLFAGGVVYHHKVVVVVEKFG